MIRNVGKILYMKPKRKQLNNHSLSEGFTHENTRLHVVSFFSILTLELLDKGERSTHIESIGERKNLRERDREIAIMIFANSESRTKVSVLMPS